MSIDDYDTNNQDSQILNGDSVENHQREGYPNAERDARITCFGLCTFYRRSVAFRV